MIESKELGFTLLLNPDKLSGFKNKKEFNFVLKDNITIGAELKKDLDFKIVDKLATLIEISYKSSSVKKGKDILNEIMNVYSRQNLDRKNLV